MKKLVALALLMVSGVLAQNKTTVNIGLGTPDEAYTGLYFWDGSGNLEYVCKAPAFRFGVAQSYTWARTPALGQGQLTSITVLTNVGTVTTSAAHGLAVGNLVTVAGATVDTDLNGAYVIATVGSATTFTITTANTANATYSEATLNISTTAPRTTANYWAIEKRVYNVSNQITADQWAIGTASGGIATTAFSFVCADRAVTTGSTRIAFQ